MCPVPSSWAPGKQDGDSADVGGKAVNFLTSNGSPCVYGAIEVIKGLCSWSSAGPRPLNGWPDVFECHRCDGRAVGQCFWSRPAATLQCWWQPTDDRIPIKPLSEVQPFDSRRKGWSRWMSVDQAGRNQGKYDNQGGGGVFPGRLFWLVLVSLALTYPGIREAEGRTEA